MKPNQTLLSFLISLAAITPLARAATLYWDGTDTTANADGGDGTWDSSATNWDTAALGGAGSVWHNSPPDFAVFPSVTGTVTLGEDIIVSGLRFDTTGYTIDTSTHSLSFGAANNSILLAGNANATITGSVGGSGNVALGPLPTLGRTLTLNGTSTGGWAGSTTVNLGTTLALLQSSQALLDTAAIALNGGGITLTNTNATEAALDRVANSAPITANGGAINLSNTAGADIYAETLGAVALTIGQSNFVLSINQTGGGSQTLTLSDLTRAGAANTSAVTFSAAATSPNTTTNMIVVTGAAATPVGQIIGPWATTGTAAGTQTDYATYNSSSQVVPAAIDATTEDAWTTSTDAYTSSGAAVVLTGNRAMNALRNTGATATITLSDDVSGFNLATNGILNAVNSQLTIAPGAVPGALTAPGSGGGQLHINTGGSRAFALTTNNNTITNNLSIDVSASITDNGGPVTLVKSGDNSVLRLTGTNTYSGGTVINAGILLVTGDAALGDSAGKITLNGGQLRSTANGVTFNREIEVGPAGGSFAGIGNQTNINFSGKLTGSGVFNMVDTSGAGGRVAFFNSTENDFTGAFIIPSNASTVRVNSLADSPGAGDIIYFKAGRGDGAGFTYGAGAIAPLVLNNRSLQIINNTGATFSSATLTNDNTTHAITVNSDLIAIGSTAKTLALGAAAGPSNLFAGKITNATGDGPVGLTKTGAGSWTLSGTNTYTGATTVSAGTLLINGNQSAATGAVAVNGTSTLGGSGTIGGTVTVAAGAKIAPGTSVGTLSILGGLDISAMAGGAGTLNYELNTTAASDKIAVSGTLTIGSGTLGLSDFVFTNLGGLQNGTYKLITSGAPVSGTLNDTDRTGTIGDIDVELKIAGNDIDLVVGGGVGGDYADWAGQFAPADLGDPNADFDGDGVSNDGERMFGLNPTSGTSVNPISVPFNPSAGTFSFTRRDPSLSGLIYQVWTSTDLVAWEVDAGAVLTPGAVVDQVQTVAVQLSAGLLDEPRLFLRVGAEEPAPPEPLLSANFEDNDGGFTVATLGGTPWAYGAPDSPTRGGGAVTAGAGGSLKCWATNLTGVYVADTDTSLRSPVIDLSAVSGATLSFARSIDAAAGHTLTVNVIAADSDTVIANVIPAAEDPNGGESPWQTIGPVELPAGALGQSVRIEWRFVGNGDEAYNGVYIDNVVVTPTP